MTVYPFKTYFPAPQEPDFGSSQDIMEFYRAVGAELNLSGEKHYFAFILYNAGSSARGVHIVRNRATLAVS